MKTNLFVTAATDATTEWRLQLLPFDSLNAIRTLQNGFHYTR